MAIETKYKKIIVSGKRKCAIAKAIIIGGNGKITINGKDSKNLSLLDSLRIEEPLRIADNILGTRDYDVAITVHGGGEKGQNDASRLALAKSILAFSSENKDLEKAFTNYDRNLLVADVRRKEACKPGDSKARSKRQSSKR